jgi:site-specific recombinase XerD
MKEFTSFLSKDKKDKQVKVGDISRDQLILALSNYRERKDGRTGREVQRSGQSVMSYYTTIKSFLNWCDSSDRLTQNPMRSVMRPKVAQRVPKALSLQDCQLFLDYAGKTNNSKRDLLLVKLGLTMGLRLSEISNIKVDDFSPSIAEPDHLKVIGKGDKERVIPVPDSVKHSLALYLVERSKFSSALNNNLFISNRQPESGSLSADGIGQVFDSILKLAGIKQPGLRVHMTRHSFATHLLNSKSADLIEVKELLGHSSVATTQVYLKIDPDKLVKSINANPLNGLS